jgi:tetratricopeptide (TPR) repeat protein
MSRHDTLRLVARIAARGRSAAGSAAQPLGDLFAHLARARAEEEAMAVEVRIWARWMSHPNAEAEAVLDRATTDIAAQRYDIAETRLTRLARTRPDYAEAWHKLGALLCMLGRDEESLAGLHRSLELEPRHFAALGAVGEVLYAERDREGAALAYEAALRLHPYMSAARARLEEIRRGA